MLVGATCGMQTQVLDKVEHGIAVRYRSMAYCIGTKMPLVDAATECFHY